MSSFLQAGLHRISFTKKGKWECTAALGDLRMIMARLKLHNLFCQGIINSIGQTSLGDVQQTQDDKEKNDGSRIMADGMELNPHKSQDISKKYKLLFLVFLFLPCLFFINNTLDNDIWFLLNSGRYVFAHGIPYMEPFTIHQGFDFVMQQWLSACIFWLSIVD